MTALKLTDIDSTLLAKEISLPGRPQGQFFADHYEIKQPFFQIFEEGYDIVSTDGRESYQATRPRSIFKNFIARFAGLIGLVATVGLTIFVASFVTGLLGLPDDVDNLTVGFSAFAGVLLGCVTYVIVARAVAPKRVLTLADKADAKKVWLVITPASSIFLVNHKWNILDCQGKNLAVFKKNFWESLIRRKWHCHSPQGKYLYSAIEDSLVMAILRRCFGIAKYIPMHFSFQKNGGKSFGEFKRRYSIKDKYHLTHDPKAVESWLVLATALLLDTGEER